jgi:Tfp pilus assembly protein PilV
MYIVRESEWDRCQEVPVLKNERGVGLVEVMVALVILLFVFMGLLQTALVSIDSNMINLLRQEAVTLAGQEIEEIRSIPFESLVSDTATLPAGVDCPSVATIGNLVERDIRSIIGKDYCVTVTCDDADSDCTTNESSKQIRVTVRWTWKDNDYTHSITTVRMED